jgi:hypothetical protein
VVPPACPVGRCLTQSRGQAQFGKNDGGELDNNGDTYNFWQEWRWRSFTTTETAILHLRTTVRKFLFSDQPWYELIQFYFFFVFVVTSPLKMTIHVLFSASPWIKR